MPLEVTHTRDKKPRGDDGSRPSPFLFLVLEANRPAAGGVRVYLGDLDRVEIGRGPELSLQRDAGPAGRTATIAVPDPLMSARHARVVRRGREVSIEDLKSRNGTLVRGAPITRATLRDGDIAEVGGTFFRFRSALTAREADRCDASGRPGDATGSLSPEVTAVHERLARVATSDVPVLVRGETGTGKELAARRVHALSGRSGAFVAVNCGALPGELVESQLFGHRRGAFTGATEDRTGLVAAAAGGTLFLDEIGDLPLPAQAALLRVLQERAVTPLGDTAARAVDFRLVCATHRDLGRMVARAAFRDDLLARIAGLEVELPPLRERLEDLGVLVAALLARLAPGRAPALDPDAARRLVHYDWPHNIRELERVLEAAVALADDEVALEHLPAALAAARPDSPDLDERDRARRDELEALLRTHNGNVSAVARALDRHRTQVQRWLRALDLDPAAYR